MTTQGYIPKKPTAPPRRRQSVYLLPLILAAVFIVGLMLIYKFRTRPAEPPPPSSGAESTPARPATRVVLIASQPSGATIWINNINTGMLTPSQLEVPAAGGFVIMLQKKGYKAFVSDRVLQELRGHKFDAVLSRPGRRKKSQ